MNRKKWNKKERSLHFINKKTQTNIWRIQTIEDNNSLKKLQRELF